MTNEKFYQIAVTEIPGIGHYLTKQLISYCGSPEAVFKETKGKLLRVPGIGEKSADAIVNATPVFQKTEHLYKRALQLDADILFYTDEAYPRSLKILDDAPCILYYKGSTDLNHNRMISIVGTRNATNYGIETVQQLVKELAPYNICIVSGLAYGIDIAVHKAALKHNIPTIGVMANGIDMIYPSVHTSTARMMETCGGLLSENTFGKKPDAPQFPMRNRIIAGMTAGTIVVEAADKGGALITAELANEYNREVMAVPGNIRQRYSMGCNTLIQHHKAHMIISGNDIAELLNWDVGQSGIAPKINFDELLEGFSGDEKKVILALTDYDSLKMDAISRMTRLSVNELASVLLNLEFQGHVKALPGRAYKLSV